jgi:hypothetical protein
MRVELDSHGQFRECLDQYLDYTGSSGKGSDILKVSFQTLSQGTDRKVEEVVGLVQNRTEPRSVKGGETQSV